MSAFEWTELDNIRCNLVSFPWRRILATCIISVWKSDTKGKHISLFLFKTIQHVEGFQNSRFDKFGLLAV